MSEKTPTDVSFETEDFATLLQQASDRIHAAIETSEVSQPEFRAWIIDYYKNELQIESMGVWQKLVEAITRIMPSQELAQPVSSVWVKCHMPAPDFSTWGYFLANIELSTVDADDPNHVNGRPALDKLQNMYDLDFVVDEHDYRARAYNALLAAKPEVRIQLYDLSDRPIETRLDTEAIHMRGDGFFGRSLPNQSIICFPREEYIEHKQTLGENGVRPLDENELFKHACLLAANNEIYTNAAKALRERAEVVPEPVCYLLERYNEEKQRIELIDTYTTATLPTSSGPSV